MTYSCMIRNAGSDGSVDSSQVSGIMKAIGQNPSDAEIQVDTILLYLFWNVNVNQNSS